MPDPVAFIGIDPTTSVRSMTCAVLDADLRIRLLATASLNELVRVILPRYERAVCGVNAAAGPNRALLMQPAYRQQVGLDPERTNYGNYRVCEYELRRRGIYVKYTPTDSGRIPLAVQEGWELYRLLYGMGYVSYPEEGPRQVFETNAQAVFTVLLNTQPYTKTSLEGMLQRQLALHEEGINVPDPIYTLQEWTRHRLLTGTVNMSDVYDAAQLDALATAFTAYVVAVEPERVVTVGDDAEGQILLPTPELRESY